MMTVRRVARIVWNAFVPIIAAAVLVFVVMLNVNQASHDRELAHKNRVAACAAVKLSNDATIDFLTGRISHNPPPDPVTANQFVRDLADAYTRANTKCLADPEDSNAQAPRSSSTTSTTSSRK